MIEKFENYSPSGDLLRKKDEEKRKLQGDYVITVKQLEDLLQKVEDKIGNITGAKGEYTIGSILKESLKSTIKFYLNKNCK